VSTLDDARVALPGEQILAAAVFDVGFDHAGLPVRRRVVVAVTPGRVHVFHAKARMTSWKLGGHLGSWDRGEITAAANTGLGSTRLTVNVSSVGVWLDLTSSAGTAADAAAVARELVGPMGAAPGSDQAGGGLSAVRYYGLVDTDDSRRLHRTAGRLAVAGGFLRLVAYLLPWVAVSLPSGLSERATVNGLTALGTPVFSLLYAAATIVVGVVYLRDHKSSAPKLLLWWGLSAMVVFVMQMSATQNSLRPAHDEILARRGLDMALSLGFGVWVELAGVLFIVTAGITAVRAGRAMAPGMAPRPDQPAGLR
jgi:hypothetical protein